MGRAAKKNRWLLRIAVDIDGGVTTANAAFEELSRVVKVLEDAGYLILDKRQACSPMIDYVMDKALENEPRV